MADAAHLGISSQGAAKDLDERATRIEVHGSANKFLAHSHSAPARAASRSTKLRWKLEDVGAVPDFHYNQVTPEICGTANLLRLMTLRIAEVVAVGCRVQWWPGVGQAAPA